MKQRINFTKKIAQFINNKFCYRKNIVIYIDDSKIELFALKKHLVIDHFYIMKDQYKEEILLNFLKKYKDFFIYFLIDLKSINIKHQSLPVIPNIIKKHPVEKFIEQNYDPKDLFGYEVFDIEVANPEIWHTIIYSLPLVDFIQELFDLIISNKLNFSGIYFMPLEIKNIINHLYPQLNKSILLIFVVISNDQSIKIYVIHDKNVLINQKIEYPNNKSDDYIYGLIEQEIREAVNNLKTFINKNQLKVKSLFLIYPEFESVIKKYNNKNLTQGKSKIIKSNESVNLFLIKLFNQNKKHQIFNSNIKSYIRLQIINKIIFKPLILAVFVIAMYMLNLLIQSSDKSNTLYDLHHGYMDQIKQYSEIENKIGKTHNVNSLLSFYSLSHDLNEKINLPFDLLRYIEKTLKINIKEINWKSLNLNKIKVTIKSELIGSNLQLAINDLEKYTTELNSILSEYQINITRDDDNIVYSSATVKIPIIIIITGPL